MGISHQHICTEFQPATSTNVATRQLYLPPLPTIVPFYRAGVGSEVRYDPHAYELFFYRPTQLNKPALLNHINAVSEFIRTYLKSGIISVTEAMAWLSRFSPDRDDDTFTRDFNELSGLPTQHVLAKLFANMQDIDADMQARGILQHDIDNLWSIGYEVPPESDHHVFTMRINQFNVWKLLTDDLPDDLAIIVSSFANTLGALADAQNVRDLFSGHYNLYETLDSDSFTDTDRANLVQISERSRGSDAKEYLHAMFGCLTPEQRDEITDTFAMYYGEVSDEDGEEELFHVLSELINALAFEQLPVNTTSHITPESAPAVLSQLHTMLNAAHLSEHQGVIQRLIECINVYMTHFDAELGWVEDTFFGDYNSFGHEHFIVHHSFAASGVVQERIDNAYREVMEIGEDYAMQIEPDDAMWMQNFKHRQLGLMLLSSLEAILDTTGE